MLILPAIDIMKGECVRLEKGDFSRKTCYAMDPLFQAKIFETAGAKWLHVVDLDGAKTGILNNFSFVQSIIEKTRLKVQFGGGLRNIEQIKSALDAGISRAVVGSLAVCNPAAMAEIIKAYGPNALAVALDIFIQGGEALVALKGWQEKSNLKLEDLIETLSVGGVENFLITDISRDGMLEGANIDLYKKIQKRFPNISIQASGGVTTMEEIKRLSDSGISAAIVGRAIYEGKLTLKDLFDVG
ncbi:MAG: 1-(5-phosphoribosyl)-5-[(5-phosphoribosylamino)methylideneamino]imidazole-4-carboxamide isomerase [Sphingomonadales bacterium]